MAKIYGHKWITHFGDMDDGTWLAGLADLTEDDLKRGLQGCVKRADPWPPTLPEFRILCLGIEDFDTVFAKILRNELANPVAAEIRKCIGSWALAHDDEDKLRKQAKTHYAALCTSGMIEGTPRIHVQTDTEAQGRPKTPKALRW